MAYIYTPDPQFAGELSFAKQLKGLLLRDNKAHIWFSLSYMPGVQDIDCLLWHEDVGIFCIEIKAIPINAIETFKFETCESIPKAMIAIQTTILRSQDCDLCRGTCQ